MKNDTNCRLPDELYDRLGVSVFLLSDPHTVMYVTGIEFPFATHFPEKPVCAVFARGEKPLLICPFEWSRAAEEQGWQGDVSAYGDNLAEAFAFLAERAADYAKACGLSSGTVGFEGGFLAAALKDALMDAMSSSCPSLSWADADEELMKLRMVKDEQELEFLTTSAEKLEFGLIGALQHLEGSLEENGYTLPEFCERIRVHVYETGGTAGGLAATASGQGGTAWYSLPRDKFSAGELVRIEATSRYMGCWANTSRMMTIGDATELQKRAYAENLMLKNRAVELLSPGVTVSAVFEAVNETAAAEGIDFRPEFGVGHGIGAAEMEAPFLTADDATELREGMCIVIAVYTEGPEKELVCVKDTYYIGQNGPVCISSFHNWDSVYEVTGFRSAH